MPAGSPIYEHMAAAAAMAVCCCCCCCFCREEPFDHAESRVGGGRDGGGGRPTNAIRPNMCVCFMFTFPFINAGPVYPFGGRRVCGTEKK